MRLCCPTTFRCSPRLFGCFLGAAQEAAKKKIKPVLPPPKVGVQATLYVSPCETVVFLSLSTFASLSHHFVMIILSRSKPCRSRRPPRRKSGPLRAACSPHTSPHLPIAAGAEVDAVVVGVAPGKPMYEKGKSGVVSARKLNSSSPPPFFFFSFSSRRGGAAP